LSTDCRSLVSFTATSNRCPKSGLMRSLSTIASAGGSKRSPESGSIRLIMTAPRHRWGTGFKLLPAPTGSENLPSANQLQGYSMGDLALGRQAVAESDGALAHVATFFMPFVRRAGRMAGGMRALAIAAGTGLSAGAALSAVGPRGHFTAADISPAMAEKAR